MKELVESEQQPAETARDTAIAGVREIMSLQKYARSSPSIHNIRSFQVG